MPQANTHSDGVKASAISATAVSAVPAASNGPADSRDSRRPVTALAITVAVVPRASRRPRAATGSWKLALIDGHNRPRVEAGRATLR